MDIFSKSRFLVRLVITLVLLDLFAIGYLWFSKPAGRNPQPPDRPMENVSGALRDKLHLSKDQEKEFVRIREDFFLKETDLVKMIKEERDSMNLEMFSEKADTARLKRAAQRVAQMEYQIELCRIEQAQQLKSVCTGEQLKEFQKLVIDIRDYLQPGKKNADRPRKQPGNPPKKRDNNKPDDRRPDRN
jgi:Spy/CpxP family protein refolding chaperone